MGTYKMVAEQGIMIMGPGSGMVTWAIIGTAGYRPYDVKE
jgi:hypothetical protein